MTTMAAAIPRSLSIGCTTLLDFFEAALGIAVVEVQDANCDQQRRAATKPAPCRTTRMRCTSV